MAPTVAISSFTTITAAPGSRFRELTRLLCIMVFFWFLNAKKNQRPFCTYFRQRFSPSGFTCCRWGNKRSKWLGKMAALRSNIIKELIEIKCHFRTSSHLFGNSLQRGLRAFFSVPSESPSSFLLFTLKSLLRASFFLRLSFSFFLSW